MEDLGLGLERGDKVMERFLYLEEGGRYLLHGVSTYISSYEPIFKNTVLLDSEKRFQITV